MTIAQISAIVALLIAFNVPQNEVNNIQAILLAAQPQTPPVVIEPVAGSPEPFTQPVTTGSPVNEGGSPPTCALEGGTTLNSNGVTVGVVNWQSTGATSGTIYISNGSNNAGSIVYKYNTPAIPVDSGQSSNWQINGVLDFHGVFTGPSGSVACDSNASL